MVHLCRCFIFLLIFSGTLSAAYARDFIVLAIPQAPFKYEENGQIKGIDVDVLRLVMKRLGLTLKVKLIDADTRLLQEAKMGRADMLLLFSKKKSRMSYLTYPEQSYIDLTWNFFIRSEDKTKITYESFADLKGLIVGATKSNAYTPEFWAAGLNLLTVPFNRLQLKMLLGKRTDIVALNTINTLYEEKNSGVLEKITYLPKALKTKPYYNVFAKASTHPDMAYLQKNYSVIIQDLKQDGVIERIFQKYLGRE